MKTAYAPDKAKLPIRVVIMIAKVAAFGIARILNSRTPVVKKRNELAERLSITVSMNIGTM